MESEKHPKRIEWEDFEHELARLCSLSSALKEAREKKLIIRKKLESLIQVKAESLGRLNELEEMREKLEDRKLAMANTSMHRKDSKEGAKKQEEKLASEVRSLLVAGTGLSMARKRFQESKSLIMGERNFVRLKNMERKLRIRQQQMVSQVSLLYPVKIMVGPAQDQELESFPSSSRLGPSIGSKPVHHGSMTILGLHLSILPSKKMSFFTDKEVQKSATALGYVAHAVLLVASYIGVPLRYPLHFGCSRSYITDKAPSVESTSSDLSSNMAYPANGKSVGFPLFLEGEDTTRAAYAVFLLNKDIEQLLNYIGLKSLGPCQILANLKELLRTILSVEYIDT